MSAPNHDKIAARLTRWVSEGTVGVNFARVMRDIVSCEIGPDLVSFHRWRDAIIKELEHDDDQD